MKTKKYILCGTVCLLLCTTFGHLQAQWQPSGNNLFYNGGNVGIGTNNLTSKFVIAESGDAMSVNPRAIGFNRSVADGIIYNPTKTAWQFTARDEMFTLEGYNGVSHYLFTVLKNGNVGIGTNNPIQKLHVNGSIYLDNVEHINGWGYSYLQWQGHSLVMGTPPGHFAMNKIEIKPGGTTQGSLSSIFELYNAPTQGQHDLKVRIWSDGNSFFNGGNVGIGTTNPTAKLTVAGDIRAREIKVEANAGADFLEGYNGVPHYLFTVLKNGNVGIGTNNPQGIFHISQLQELGSQKGSYTNIHIYSAKCGVTNNMMNNLWLLRDNNGSNWYTSRLHDGVSVDVSYSTPGVDTKTWWERDPYDDIQAWGNDKLTYMVIKGGNIGMGTTSPNHKLDVVGTVRAHEIIVNTQNGGADFVFADDYHLRSLTEVERFISENKHLPDIAPATDMEQNGIGVSEMQIKLLQKVEELTLYVIEQEKKIEMQQKEIDMLKNRDRN